MEGTGSKHTVLMASDFFFPNFGGVESHIYYLSQCLLQLGHKVVVVTHCYGRRSGVRYMTNGLKVYYLPWLPFFMQNTLPTFCCSFPVLRTIMIREGITIVHGHQAFSTLCHEAILHARTMGFKTVFTDHSLYGFADVGSIHMNKVLQFTLVDVQQAICVSHTSKENTVLRSGIHPDKVFVIPNAVDTAMFQPQPSAAPKDRIVIVIVSRLVYRKGADLLVEVIPEVCKRFPNVDFIVGGDGPKRVRLEEMRERNSLQDRVEMLGAVPHSMVSSVLSARELAEFQRHVLPPDMIVLSEPVPAKMVEAIEKAIRILPQVDPQEMHNRMTEMYSWMDVAKRTEAVYDEAARADSSGDFMARLGRCYTCGPWAGKLFCLVAMLDYIVGLFLQWWQEIEVVPSYLSRLHEVYSKSRQDHPMMNGSG